MLCAGAFAWAIGSFYSRRLPLPDDAALAMAATTICGGAATLTVGGRVAMVSHNAARLLTSFFGVAGHGRVLVPVNFRLNADEVRYILDNELDFREYVLAYTNAATIVSDDFRDTEDLDGLFSGFDPQRHGAVRVE